MVCPLRAKTTYIYNDKMVNGALVLNAQFEEWPECYGHDCPFYNTWSKYSCSKLEEESNE